MKRIACGNKRYAQCRVYTTYSSGPQGVEGRLPFDFQKIQTGKSSSVVITDPFQLYQSYISLGILEKDDAQLRVMKEFQKLYYRVVDYKPPQDMAIKASILLRKLEIREAEDRQKLHSRKDPLHKLKLWFRKDIDTQRRELVRFMSDEEELHNIAAPQGLLVNGEVGCGKSMLMDIFANSLPHQSKMRWHYNNFILWVFGEIHAIQKERMLTAAVSGKHKMTIENEFILFEIAQKMITKSTIFMLDEFMLPDVASSQIVRILFTYYFKLGGVLVTTSNKLPEELYSSEFNKTRFESFVGILNSRCVAVDMRSDTDYRVKFALSSSEATHMVVKKNNPNHEPEWNALIKANALGIDKSSVLLDPSITLADLPSKPATITVYNRSSEIPKTFNNKTVCLLSFDHICKSRFSSSDYITLASIYKTVIIDDIPIMTTKMRNEARRFITLLDALYEARCQLFIRSDVEVEDLFFPEEINNEEQAKSSDNSGEVQEAEMFARTTLDTLNPYRPNVTSYDEDYAKEYKNSGKKVDFGNTKAFTGEDEEFAYKRAVSRIKEMVGSDHWRKSDRWIPVDIAMRPWEVSSKPLEFTKEYYGKHCEFKDEASISVREVKNALNDTLPKDLSSQYNMSFRDFNRKLAPSISSPQHFWAIGEWTVEQQKRIKDKIAQKWVEGNSSRK